jgi:hypothetical protein
MAGDVAIRVGEVESNRELEDLEGARLVEVGTERVALEIHEAVSNTRVALTSHEP